MSARRKPFRPTPAPAIVPSRPSSTASDINEMNRRVDNLERLYYQDGRDNPDHPHSNTYTGLAAASAAARSVDVSRLLAPSSRRAVKAPKAKRKK